jgi:hypothetical protein
MLTGRSAGAIWTGIGSRMSASFLRFIDVRAARQIFAIQHIGKISAAPYDIFA